MLDFLRRHLQSIFTRLGLVMLCMVVVINCGTWLLYIRFHSRADTADSRHMARYARFLAEAVGSPPDRAKAQALVADLPLRVTVGGEQGWSVGRPGDFPEAYLTLRPLGDGVSGGVVHGHRRMVVTAADGSTLTFDSFPTEPELASFRLFAVLSLALTWVVVLAGYGVMRWLLRPVRWLSEGAAAVRDGAYDHQVPETCGGGLLELSRTFNEMTSALRATLCAQKRLLIDVGHELRTPITRLKLALELLPDRERAEAMREDVDDMEVMVVSILESARLRHEVRSVHAAPVDLVELTGVIAARYADTLPGVTVDLPGEPVWVMADGEKLAMVVRNLLDNACKYSRGGDAPIAVALAGEREWVVLTVADHGPGIPAEALPHIFEPFYRVDASRTRDTGGFGLGLSLCQAIVRAHGGRIAATNGREAGLTVTVAIPRQAPATPRQ
ncbi:HAMP domain-containing sensor histidine kinase [Desulfovibrio sp. TomC]|uniref:HAMP domain-containing sensor histidine kinase n=1 Tax=Desulfovibrio sp. TomC TaxID=1562888 RepID=UPI0005733FE1|nr:HAMP domain-containing sensor histidine kinase [Desulfovibrio sp. TomC]KHK01032.1 sensor histidine kinase [Desulfovibrio sp. TomC]